MTTIKTKETVDRFGFEKVLYKLGRKTLAEITKPNEFNGMKYRTSINITRYGGICGDWATMEKAREVLKDYFEGVYFGNVVIC